jgi:hypothetical protein
VIFVNSFSRLDDEILGTFSARTSSERPSASLFTTTSLTTAAID